LSLWFRRCLFGVNNVSSMLASPSRFSLCKCWH
jgi:hypothetical protein